MDKPRLLRDQASDLPESLRQSFAMATEKPKLYGLNSQRIKTTFEANGNAAAVAFQDGVLGAQGIKGSSEAVVWKKT